MKYKPLPRFLLPKKSLNFVEEKNHLIIANFHKDNARYPKLFSQKCSQTGDVSIWDDYIGEVNVTGGGPCLFNGSISNQKITREIWEIFGEIF